MNTDAELLARLAERAGIEADYVDTWGERHMISDVSRRALLAAMGLPAEDATQIDAALERLDSRVRAVLPPVVVLRPGEALTLTLPAASSGGLRWHIDTESGQAVVGEIGLHDLEVDTHCEIGGADFVRRRLPLPDIEIGYHRFTAALGGQPLETRLIVAPARAWRPSALEADGRRWGLAVQLYGLRSARNWGIGDFTDLAALMRGAAQLGAAAIGVNPLHALFPRRPEHASPYSPSSRLFVNPLYLDVEAIEDFAHCEAARAHLAEVDFQSRLTAARAAECVDYRAVAELKWPLFEMLYADFRTRCLTVLNDPRAQAFREFQRERGSDLRHFATFHALADTRAEIDWRHWPAELADPESKQVAAFAARHIEAIEFHEYLQWQAARQLAAVNAVAREGGMAVGLYADLAVGADPTGAEAWGTQQALVAGATVGAPPDQLNLQGQNWGLPPLDPLALVDAAYAPFIALLRANMRNAGALRIDHILGLVRFYWVPRGASAQEGAYVRYPWRDLLGLLALESHRQQCLVVGEDLGTVPAGLREAMQATGILSYRLLYFEQHDRDFRRPHEYPADALVAVGTHDLPTLPAYWHGEDIALRERLDLWPSEAMRTGEIDSRLHARAALAGALREAGLLAGEGVPDDTPVEAIYAYLARTPCKLLMVQLEDVLGQHTQINVPGTTDEYPNWRQRLAVEIGEALAHPRMRAIAATLDEIRGEK